jgi:hypothetical protein
MNFIDIKTYRTTIKKNKIKDNSEIMLGQQIEAVPTVQLAHYHVQWWILMLISF